MGGYKVRLGDGSEIGPMDLEALKTWQLQGLVDGDSPVMRSGTRKWVPLRTLPEFKGATRTGASRSKKARRQVNKRPVGSAEEFAKLVNIASDAKRILLLISRRGSPYYVVLRW